MLNNSNNTTEDLLENDILLFEDEKLINDI